MVMYKFNLLILLQCFTLNLICQNISCETKIINFDSIIKLEIKLINNSDTDYVLKDNSEFINFNPFKNKFHIIMNDKEDKRLYPFLTASFEFDSSIFNNIVIEEDIYSKLIFLNKKSSVILLKNIYLNKVIYFKKYDMLAGYHTIFKGKFSFYIKFSGYSFYKKKIKGYTPFIETFTSNKLTIELN